MHVVIDSIVKSYNANLVLDNVSLEVWPGQIHALVGENGAGKSTLMKILIGVEVADSGDIYIDGKKTIWRHPIDARKRGISMVFQELSLVPMLSVCENLFLGRYVQNRQGIVNWKAMREQAKEVFRQIEFDMDVDVLVEELSIADRQMVEIARALAHNAELIILDEPTSPLSDKEAQLLFHRIRTLSQQGVAFVYISHRLDEVFDIADHITVLRDGRLIRSCPIRETNADSVIQDMVGRELTEQFPGREKGFDGQTGDVLLNVQNASKRNQFYDVSFQVHQGEIVGLAGLVGAGRTELVEALFGVTGLDSGSVQVRGKTYKIDTPNKAVKSELGLIPDDRKIKGLVTDADVGFNLNMATQFKYATRWGWRRWHEEENAASRLVRRLKVKLHSLHQSASSLSGGNQQKVAIGKTLNTDSKILIFDEPTRGIDVGAKREIYFLIRRLADEGAAVILVSSEIEEILGLSDRILVMHQGRIMGEMNADEATQEKIMQLAVGMS